jgi:hypothetical protein
MPPSSEKITETAAGVVDIIRADLDQALTDLGDAADDIRQDAARTLQLASEVAMLELAGEDTALAQQALAGSFQAIRARTTIEVAATIRTAIQTGWQRLAGRAIGIIAAL